MANEIEEKKASNQRVYFLDTCTISSMAQRAAGYDPTDDKDWGIGKKKDYVENIDSLIAHIKSGDVKFVIPETVVEELNNCQDPDIAIAIRDFWNDNFSQADVFPAPGDKKTGKLIEFYAKNVLQNSEMGAPVHYKNGVTEYVHYEIFDWLKGAHANNQDPINWVSNDAIIMSSAQVYQVLTGAQVSLITDNTTDFVYGPVSAIPGREEKVNKQHVIREVNYDNQDGLFTTVAQFAKDVLERYNPEKTSDGEHQASLRETPGATALTVSQAAAEIETGKIVDVESSRPRDIVFMDFDSPTA